MPIRPIDLQVSIPKMSEVARMKHLEQHKSGLQQEQNATVTDKSVNKESQTVMQSEADSKADTDADSRKKGRNEYFNKKNKGQKNEDDQEVIQPKSKNKIDIRI